MSTYHCKESYPGKLYQTDGYTIICEDGLTVSFTV